MTGAAPPLSPLGCLRYDVVSRWVEQIRPATVLEIGCGQGAIGARLARRAKYLGLEPDPASFAIARERIMAVGGEVLNADDTALAEGQVYDLVCAFEVLEYLEDDTAALERWQRLIRPGGYLMLSVPAWPRRFGPSDEVSGHFRRYTPDQMQAQLVGAGLNAPQVKLYGWPLGPVMENVRNAIAKRRAARSEGDPIEERKAGSARLSQSRQRLAGAAVRLGTRPFAYLQRLAPTRGVALIAVAQQQY